MLFKFSRLQFSIMARNNCKMNSIYLILKLVMLICSNVTFANTQFDHSAVLDNNFKLLWNVEDDSITFEMQVRTHGYVALGFALDGSLANADIVIGWINQGQAQFQVSD